MRLIDADALERHVYTEWVNGELSNSEWVDFRQWLKDEPTVEPASPWRMVEEPPKYAGRYVVWCGVNWHGEGMHDDIMIARYDARLGRWYVEADHSLKGPICGDIRYWMPSEQPKEDA